MYDEARNTISLHNGKNSLYSASAMEAFLENKLPLIFFERRGNVPSQAINKTKEDSKIPQENQLQGYIAMRHLRQCMQMLC